MTETCPRCHGDHAWCQSVQDDEFGLVTPSARAWANSIQEETAFQRLITTLLVSYTPMGVHVWLGSANKHLDGMSPISAWASGEHARVQEAAYLIGDAS